MPESREMRRLQAKWQMNTGWPQRLDWIEIDGLRGWEGQRFDLPFPIMALVAENGGGKSTVLQALASVYAQGVQGHKDSFASDFFPDTPWDHVTNASIRYAVREAGIPHENSVRKPTGRWRGNPDRRRRRVEYIDLSRIQPVPARTGYSKIANPAYREVSAVPFETGRLARFSQVLGRTYDLAKLALSDADTHRSVPVITQQGSAYSGFHQGAGETTIFELLQRDIPKHALVLIDEIESSLHPRAQRRLLRDIAERCREGEWQVVITTHSPYILEELPLEARAYILQTGSGNREFVYGVSPDFAMTQMDDVTHYECDLYVEDSRSGRMLVEILSVHAPKHVQQCQVIPYGAASVGRALGQMIVNKRFPRRSCVFLDADAGPAPGCALLPGDDAPERVVFESLQARRWVGVDARIGRQYAQVVDACDKAMNLTTHHDWITYAGTQLLVGGETLWQAMTAEWAATGLLDSDGEGVAQLVSDVFAGIEDPAATAGPNMEASPLPARTGTPDVRSASVPAPTAPELPLWQSPDDPPS